MLKYSILLIKYNKYLTHFAIYVLLICGLYLRLQKIPSDWNPDIAKQFLTSYHIVKFHEYPLVGPYAEGSDFFYPPFLDYFYSVPMLISTNIFFIIGLIAILHSLAIILIYLTGTLYYQNRYCGLLAAVFYTFATTEIFYSRSITGHIVIPFALISFYFFLQFLKTSKKILILISYLFMLTGSLFNYPLALFSIIYAWEIYKKYKSIVKPIALNTVFYFSLVCIHLPLLINSNGFDFTTRKQFIFSDLASYLNIFFESIFYHQESKVIGTTAFSVLLVINLIFQKSMIKKNRPLILLFFINFIFVVLIHNNLCCTTYYLAVYPLFFIFSSYLAVNILKSKRIISKVFSLVLIMILILTLSANYEDMYTKHNKFTTFEEVADIIIKDTKIHSIDNYNAIFASPDLPIIFDPMIWYFFEVKTGKKVVNLVNNKYKFEMISVPEVLYVYWQNNYKSNPDRYLKKYKMYKLKSEIYKNNDYTLYRLIKS